MRKLALLFSVILLGSIHLFGQNQRVSGVVTGPDGNPLSGVTVIVTGTTTATVTDANGQYSINVPASGSLDFSLLGMVPRQEAVSSRTTINVQLQGDAQAIENVVVVAFGTKRAQDLVGSVSAVKPGIIANSQASSVTNALEGAVAGLQVISSSGQPGDDANIYLRGLGSRSASNAALIVVDGVPFNGKLSDINPADIASIYVSKDAVSNSLYGSRAANGVVMVTTKTGRKDRISLEFQGRMGVSNRAFKDYNMVTDPGEFYELTWFGLRNTAMMGTTGVNGLDATAAAQYATDRLLGELGNYNAFIIPEGQPLVGTDGKLNSAARPRYNDSFADALFDTALRQEYVVSASGGNDKSDYYLSMGYLDNDSYVLASGYKRFTSRVNVNSQLKEWVKAGMNLSYSKTTRSGVQEGVGLASNPFDVARSWASIFPVHAYDLQGKMKLNPDGSPMYDAGNGETDGTTERPTATNQNIINSMTEDLRETISHNLSSRSYVEFRILKDFTLTANYSYDFTNRYMSEFYTPTIGDGQSFNGRGTKQSENTATTNFNQILAYNKVFGDSHNFSAKLGHEYYQRHGKYLDGQKTNFLNPDNPELINGGQMIYTDSYTYDHNIEGYFAMADYNYANKYYLSATFRRDGTSRFLDRWGNFWSVGAGWRISAENFMMSASSWMNDLKLRASYGTQGNENIRPGNVYGFTPYMDQYSVTWDGSSLGLAPAFYGNPDLTWEKPAIFDVGLDFRFWDRVYGNVDYYIRTTHDMLFQKTLPISAGRPYNWENLGKMRNAGIEFEVNVDIFNRNDFRWTATLIGSHYKNTMLTLPEENREEGITDGNFKLMEGKSMYDYFTWEYAGIQKDSGVFDSGIDQGKDKIPGAPLWYYDILDANGDPTGERGVTQEYGNATRYYIGKTALPDFTGGFNTSLYYKGIDLSIAAAFQLGGWGYDSYYLDGMSASFYVGHNKDMWNTYNPATKEGSIPVWNANNTANAYTRMSDTHLVSLSYFSIRNMTIGYNFPKKWMDELGIQGIRVFVSADNMALWSKRQGYDPRVSINGSDVNFGGYSPMRVISGGLNLTF
jgi:TonB-linked SusC/RagA family outer membrane protein